jgi:hypothetical protein
MDQTASACGIILNEANIAGKTDPKRVTFKSTPLLISVLLLALLAGIPACTISPRPAAPTFSKEAEAEQAFASGD